jgi:hypothetical protein
MPSSKVTWCADSGLVRKNRIDILAQSSWAQVRDRASSLRTGSVCILESESAETR